MTRAEVEDFLYAEAELLDAWKLEDWLALWTPDARYIVPSTDAPDADPSRTLCLIADDLAMLRSRVDQLLHGSAWAEVPRSRTQHSITNVRILEQSDDKIVVASVFVVHRFRGARSDMFVGSYRHELSARRIREKRVVLAHEHLYDQGKISIIL